MAIANYFYNETTKKYVAVFGTIFNKLTITRKDNTGNEIQSMIVPIAYGPYQKFMAKITQDPELSQKSAITLPRMSFEITSMVYDGTRKVGSLKKLDSVVTPASGETEKSASFQYTPTPYNIDFSLSIMAKYAEDGTQLLEQIIPFFKPERTTTVKLIDGIEPLDIPLILNTVTMEDIYDGDFETRRSLLWTLDFTMKAWYFGPVREKRLIKFIDTHYFTDTKADAEAEEQVIVRPGLTANGEPTTDANNSISYLEIMEDDDWGVIIMTNEL